jgi:hypothetical protein
MTTKVISGITYHQDPTDPDLWYDRPERIGTPDLACATFEIDDIREALKDLRRQLRITDEPETIEEIRRELDERTADLALLTALTA